MTKSTLPAVAALSFTPPLTPPQTAQSIEASLDARLSFTPVPRRAKRWNGLTPLKQRTFIQNLADSGSETMDANSIGTSTSAMYSLRRGEGAESFAAAWEAAIEIGARRVLDTLIEHAIHGTPETIIQGGEVVAERRRYNHRAMMWIVSQRFPEQYGGATGLMDMNGMSHAMRKLKAKWEEEWEATYEARRAAADAAQEEQAQAAQDAQQKELLPAVLVQVYTRKVAEERRYRVSGQTASADAVLRQLTHLELYMEFTGLVEADIKAFFNSATESANTDPHPWETEASRAIEAHRRAVWASDPFPRPAILNHGPQGPKDAAISGGPTHTDRHKARIEAERQMAQAHALWEACATEESMAGFGGGVKLKM